MIVEYATWEADAPDFDLYLDWMERITAECRAEDGCLAYEFRVDPRSPERGALFQAWESPEAFEAHLVFPAHAEFLAEDKPWKARHVVIRRWTASGHDVIER